MKTSLLELFKVGLGPSSSHTVGPMKAANHFLQRAPAHTHRFEGHLYGSLALTGRGHATDRAVLLGLQGHTPEGIPVDQVAEILRSIDNQRFRVCFHEQEWMPEHPNGLKIQARDSEGQVILEHHYYSVGGGTIRMAGEGTQDSSPPSLPHPYSCADELLKIGQQKGLAIWQIGLENELAWRSLSEIDDWLMRIWRVMQECVERGMRAQGSLPGGLQVQRRARALASALDPEDPLSPLDWVEVYALAVNEENAAGGRVVTAPTNG
ncbi:L-serine ammonia-lyase, iron-sulfur-dependent, subunit alpha, partial [bacterium]|nr:L-serine ammonia-lyase, iron-sulfur-dependent, subunit alpha [bacterium]